MLWLMTMGRRLNGVYAAFMLVAFMMGVAGALQAPTLSLFLSREVGAQPFWVGLFYTVNAIAGILVSLALAKRSDSQGDRRKLILFCCAMAVGNALLFAFNRHYLTLITCGVLLASLANTAMPQLFALAREYADSSATGSGDVQLGDACPALAGVGHWSAAGLYAGVELRLYHHVHHRGRDFCHQPGADSLCAAVRGARRTDNG
jgi:hypothetical protein